MIVAPIMKEQAVIPSPALLAGEDEGEGTEQLGCGGARDLNRRFANRNPHLNPLPRVVLSLTHKSACWTRTANCDTRERWRRWHGLGAVSSRRK